MLNCVRSDLNLAKKNKVILLSSIIYLLFFVFMFFQKIININSGFYQPEIVTPFYSIAFGLALLCYTNSFIMSIAGGVVGGESFENNTISINVLVQGRYKAIVSKALALLSLSAVLSACIVIIGFVSGLTVSRSFDDMNIQLVFKCFLISILMNVNNGIFAFLLSYLFRRIFIGIFLSIIGGFLLSWLSGLVNIFHSIINKDYMYVILSDAFKIISEREDVQLVINPYGSPEQLLKSYFLCISIVAVCVGITLLISRIREYNV